MIKNKKKVYIGSIVSGAVHLISAGILVAILVYYVGYVMCESMSGLRDEIDRAQLLAAYTDVDILLQGAVTIIGIMVMAYALIKIFKIEIAECPLQKDEDETEETE